MTKGTLVIAAAVLCACAPARSVRMSSAPSAIRLSNVPFFPDGTDQCGPSTLASVLSFWGKKVTPADLRREIYLPKLKGTLPMDMEPAVQAHGLSADVTTGSIERVRSEIRQGRPVLAYVDVGFKIMPVGHYVVITGFDDGRSGFYMHSGKKENQFVRYEKFLMQWEKTDYWMLSVSPLAARAEAPR